MDSERPPLEAAGLAVTRAPSSLQRRMKTETDDDVTTSGGAISQMLQFFFLFFSPPDGKKQSMSERTRHLPRIPGVDKEPSINPYQTMQTVTACWLLEGPKYPQCHGWDVVWEHTVCVARGRSLNVLLVLV